MAKTSLKLEENIEGNFFVDSTCIDCSACRRFAPTVFGETGEYSFVYRQPQTDQEMLEAQRALLSCPTSSIGTHHKTDLKPARQSFPLELVPGIHINGFNAQDSFGADSYFIQHPNGNWLVDSPRFTNHLVKAIESMGGIDTIFLTHQDDVVDARDYAHHFNAKRIIHRLDADAQKDAEIILEGEEDSTIGPGTLIFTPGHTRGHLVLLWEDKYLFTGDHFSWVPKSNRFGSFRNACWFSWDIQIKSVEKLKSYENVEWVFPGHGHRGKVEKKTFPAYVDEAVKWMKTVR
ncbi:MAG: MBL fold metallo-hydrolase [Nitrospinota bacterium]|nr:MBL fold metallo-hydrolase [Nitrospinota bacterium]